MNTSRSVILHHHLFKNAGSTIDWALQRSYGDGFIDHRDNESMRAGAEYLSTFLRNNEDIQALSTHHLRLPLPIIPRININLLMMFRHPIERVSSVYHFEKLQEPACTLGSIKAKELSFSEYVLWRMRPDVPPTIRNFHTVRCLPKRNFLKFPINELDLVNAKEFVANVQLLGLVDKFDDSMVLFESVLRESNLEVDLSYQAQNVSQGLKVGVESRVCAIKDKLGDVFNILLQNNQYDILLYDFAVSELDKRIKALPDRENKMQDFESRRKSVHVQILS